MGKLDLWLSNTQDKYTAWENDVLDKLGPIGRYLKKRIAKKMSEPDWKRLNKIWYLIVIFAFVSGWCLAGFYYQVQSNKFIIETFYPEYSCKIGLKCDKEYTDLLGVERTIKLIGQNLTITLNGSEET